MENDQSVSVDPVVLRVFRRYKVGLDCTNLRERCNRTVQPEA